MSSIPGRGNTSKKPDNKPAGQVVSFTRGAADRIAKVVRTVERGDTSAEGLRFARPNDVPSVKQIRLATFTGAWQIGSSKTVTFKNQTTTPNTAKVANLTFSLFPFGTATSFDCIITPLVGQNTASTSTGTASWALVSAEERPVRIATFTGAWATGTDNAKQITFVESTHTATAINLLRFAPNEGTPQTAAVAINGTSWQAISLPETPTFRVCTFGSAAWSKGSAATVTFKNVTSTPNTTSAVNLFANIATASTSRSCAIAKEGTAWYLIAAECD